MLNVISTCRNILCVDINVDKRCVDHGTSVVRSDFFVGCRVTFFCRVQGDFFFGGGDFFVGCSLA